MKKKPSRREAMGAIAGLCIASSAEAISKAPVADNVKSNREFMFDSVEQGLAATPNKQLFQVLNLAGVGIYRNHSGVAVQIGTSLINETQLDLSFAKTQLTAQGIPSAQKILDIADDGALLDVADPILGGRYRFRQDQQTIERADSLLKAGRGRSFMLLPSKDDTGMSGAAFRDSTGLMAIRTSYVCHQNAKLDPNGQLISGSDDAALLNEAIAEAAHMADSNEFWAGGWKLIIDGKIHAESSINVTKIRNLPFTIEGVPGSMIYSTAAGKLAVDAIQSRFTRWKGVKIVGDKSRPPAAGLVFGRNSSGQAASHHVLEDVVTAGYFQRAAVAMIASEECTIYDGRFQNDYDAEDAVSLFFGAENSLRLKSEFEEILPLGKSGSNNGLSLVGRPAFTKQNNGRPIWICSAHGIEGSPYLWMKNASGNTNSFILVTQDRGGRSNERFDIAPHAEATEKPEFLMSIEGGDGINRSFSFGKDWNPAVKRAVIGFNNSRGIFGLRLPVTLAGRAPWAVIDSSLQVPQIHALELLDDNHNLGGKARIDLNTLSAASGSIHVSDRRQIVTAERVKLLEGSDTGHQLQVSTLTGAFDLLSPRTCVVEAATGRISKWNGSFCILSTSGSKPVIIRSGPPGLPGERVVIAAAPDTSLFVGAGGMSGRRLVCSEPLPQVPRIDEGTMVLRYCPLNDPSDLSGWIVEGFWPASTFSRKDFEDLGHEVNCIGKKIHVPRWDSSSRQQLWPAGNQPSDPWTAVSSGAGKTVYVPR